MTFDINKLPTNKARELEKFVKKEFAKLEQSESAQNRRRQQLEQQQRAAQLQQQQALAARQA